MRWISLFMLVSSEESSPILRRLAYEYIDIEFWLQGNHTANSSERHCSDQRLLTFFIGWYCGCFHHYRACAWSDGLFVLFFF